MEITIENPERTLRVIDTLLLQEYPIELKSGLQSWLEEVRTQILQKERIDRFKSVWRRVPDFPKYEISGSGKVRRRDDDGEIHIEPNPDGNSYIRLQRDRGTYILNLTELRNQAFPEIMNGVRL